jgi:ArsR family transcriptional regulator
MIKDAIKPDRRKLFNIDDRIFEGQAVICKAFAHPKRLKLLSLLGKGERRMSELQKELALSPANLSQHVAVLRSAGVIDTYRKGHHMYCFLAFQEVKQACHLIQEVLRSQIRKQTKFAL